MKNNIPHLTQVGLSHSGNIIIVNNTGFFLSFWDFQVGSMLITHWGLSGPVILRLSAWGARYLFRTGYKGISVSLSLSLSPWPFTATVNFYLFNQVDNIWMQGCSLLTFYLIQTLRMLSQPLVSTSINLR